MGPVALKLQEITVALYRPEYNMPQPFCSSDINLIYCSRELFTAS